MLPTSLLYICERLAGFSTNTFRLDPIGSTSARPSGTVSFDLPSNSIVNLRSFRVFFEADVLGTVARLPADIHSLIERVEVRAGSQTLSQGSNFFNVMLKAQQAVCDKKPDPLSHSEIVRAKSYVDGAVISAVAPEAYSSKFCWNDWSNTFVGTCEPSFIDTSVLPDIRITITLADNAVLSSSTSSALSSAGFLTAPTTPNATYTLSSIHGAVECVSFADGTYDKMVSSLMSQGGFIEMPYKTMYSWEDTHSGSTPFSVATQSLDRIWLTYRASTYSVQGAPVVAVATRDRVRSLLGHQVEP